jgi:hypothetical protein
LPSDETSTESVDENGYESECSLSSLNDAEVTYSTLETEADAFTRFIERQRMEVMFELRRLRLGERPVTGQPNRERLANFISNAQENRQEVRTPSTRAATPSAHTADINALMNRRCVTAALASVAFRRDLESAIRNSISTPPPVAIPQPPTLPTVAPIVPRPVEQPQTTPPALNLER